MDERAEYGFILAFAHESSFDDEIVCQRLRILWTAFCLHQRIDLGADKYETYLDDLWEELDEEKQRTTCWTGMVTFYIYMREYLK